MKRRILFLGVALSLLLTFFSPIIKANADDTYIVKVGKKLTLKSSLEKPVWGSSNTAIATVSKKGVVKGKSKGICYITAVSDGKAEVFTINVKAKTSANAKLPVKTHMHDGYKTDWEGKRILYGNVTWFDNMPSVCFDGYDMVYGQNTLEEVVKHFKNSKYALCVYTYRNNDFVYLPFDEDTLNDLTTGGTTLFVLDDKQTILAEILFSVDKKEIVKDLVVHSVKLKSEAYTNKNTYYLNKGLNPSSIPVFEDFDYTKLVSGDIKWSYNIYAKRTEYKSQEIYYNEGDYEIGGYLFFTITFDNHTHKCIDVQISY